MKVFVTVVGILILASCVSQRQNEKMIPIVTDTLGQDTAGYNYYYLRLNIFEEMYRITYKTKEYWEINDSLRIKIITRE